MENPDVILLDEPFNALDKTMKMKSGKIVEIIEENGYTS